MWLGLMRSWVNITPFLRLRWAILGVPPPYSRVLRTAGTEYSVLKIRNACSIEAAAYSCSAFDKLNILISTQRHRRGTDPEVIRVHHYPWPVPDMLFPQKKPRIIRDTNPEEGVASRFHKRQTKTIGLLDLPLEIIQLITWHMDTSTFYTSLLTCKKFLQAAECRQNILRHLLRLPGLRLGLHDVATPQLLSIFRKRAAMSLCGAGVLADVKRYAPIPSSVSLGKAVFSAGSPAHLAIAQNFHIVHIYDLNHTSVRLKTELQSIFPHSSAVNDEYDVVKMAFSSTRDLAILYKPKVPVGMPANSPFVKNTKIVTNVLKLVTFHYTYSHAKGHFYSNDQQESRDIECDIDYLPVGLGIAVNGNACISFKPPGIQGRDGGTELWLVLRSKYLNACSYDPTPKVVVTRYGPNMGYPSGRIIFDMQFIRKGKGLNFYKPGTPIHTHFTTSADPETFESRPARENLVLIDVGGEGRFHRFAIGMPFFGVHTAGARTANGLGASHCQSSYLAIGITADYGAFIMGMSRASSELNCSHTVDLERGRRTTDWSPIAFLAGWRDGSSSSLGSVMATSQGGGRIAAATWTEIRVWTFHPSILHEGHKEQYFPPRDYNTRKGIGRLRPTVLSNEGVVYKMIWVGENNLYATTDRGLVQYDMSALAEGEKDDMSLAHDAWPENAVERPLINFGSRFSSA